MQDYVAPTPIDLRTCAAAGTKFFDLDADGVRDANEPGIPGFQIFADYNDNGRLDAGEPSTVSDSSGRYVLDDIRSASYRLRERLLRPAGARRTTGCARSRMPVPTAGSARAGLECGWGPIDPRPEPYATGRDFGNWYPAQLTVRKELAPASDPGRFDLLVNDELVVPGAAGRVLDDARRSAGLLHRLRAGGRADRSEPVRVDASRASCSRAGADAGRHRLRQRRARRRRPGHVHVPQRASRLPAIAIDKSGPAIAQAGDTLHYTLLVTNPGSVPFPEDQVRVTDPACDDAPELSDKSDGQRRRRLAGHPRPRRRLDLHLLAQDRRSR